MNHKKELLRSLWVGLGPTGLILGDKFKDRALQFGG